MARYAIGDIHSSYDKLMRALDRVGFSDSDELFPVGDFCDRGKQPLEVLRFIMSHKNVYPVFGNHDVYLYEYLMYHITDPLWTRGNGGSLTKKSMFRIDLLERARVREYLAALPLFIDTGDVMIMHNLPPAAVADCYMNEKAPTLRDAAAMGVFRERELIWSRAAADRVVTGCFNYADRRSLPDRFIIFGHTPLRSPIIDMEHRLAMIDTGAFLEGQELTVMDIDSKEIV